MAEHDDNLVTSQAGSVIAENQYVTLGTASGSITPSTITAMVGIANNASLQIAPAATEALGKLHFSNIANVSLWPAANIAYNNLSTFQSTVLPSGNQAAFGSILTQAKNHIKDSVELKKATNFIANTNYSEYGSGITNMSSMATQGLNTTFGDLGSAANAFTSAGPCFDLTDMGTFGTGAGFANKLNNVKLGNASGLNEALAKNGVDLDNITDPVYSDSITKTLSSINDPATISSVTDQLGISPYGKISNLNDFTDLNKLSNPLDVSGLTCNLTDVGTKFKDLGANFPSPSSASDMLNNIEIPDIPNLEAATPSLNKLITDNQSTFNGLTGTGTGELGMPSMTDFIQGVAGGPEIDALNAEVNASTIAALNTSTVNATGLFSKAGVDFASLPNPGLGSSMNFATSLHKFGTNSEMSGLLSNMAVSGSQYGDAIKASLAEGKNKALMVANGIRPLNFQG